MAWCQTQIDSSLYLTHGFVTWANNAKQHKNYLVFLTFLFLDGAVGVSDPPAAAGAEGADSPPDLRFFEALFAAVFGFGSGFATAFALAFGLETFKDLPEHVQSFSCGARGKMHKSIAVLPYTCFIT